MKRYLWVTLMLLILIFAFTGCALPNPNAGQTPIGSPIPSTAPAKAQSTTSEAPPVLSSNGLPQGSLYSSVTGLEATLESIYDQLNPSVVNIQVLQKAQTPSSIFPGLSANPRFPSIQRRLGFRLHLGQCG